MTIIAVFNQKGGVGKTTTALNLAAALQRTGRNTYCLDMDPQAQLSFITGIEAHSGSDTLLSLFEHNRPLHALVQQAASQLKVIPSHSELSKVDALFGKSYNVVNKLCANLKSENIGRKETPLVIDCCPMIGVLSLNALFACDGVIVPISADHLSLKGALQLEKSLNVLEPVLKRRIQRRYLLTRYDARRNMAREVASLAEQHFGPEVSTTRIAENVSLAESPSFKQSVFEYAPSSNGARDYEQLMQELLAGGFID